MILLAILFAQYIYYSIQQMMFQESTHALYKKTEQLDKIRTDIILLEERVAELGSNDRKLLARIDANKLAIDRQIDMVEQRLPPVKPIKKVKS